MQQVGKDNWSVRATLRRLDAPFVRSLPLTPSLTRISTSGEDERATQRNQLPKVEEISVHLRLAAVQDFGMR
jgi:hypothetical protein